MNRMDEKEIHKMDLEDRNMGEYMEKYRNTIIDEIKSVGNNDMFLYATPSVRYKKPFKVRFNEFIDKLRKVLGL